MPRNLNACSVIVKSGDGVDRRRWSACCMAADSTQSKRQTSPELHQK
jgi:hypothetical protein